MKKIDFKKITIKKVIKWVIILFVILFIGYSIYKSLNPVQAVQETMTSQAVVGEVKSMISGNGTLSPANQYEVKSLVKGEILEASFEEGDSVKKGEVLYQISTNDIENSISSAELNVKKAKITYEDYKSKKEELQIEAKESGYIKKLYIREGDTLQLGSKIADIYNGDVMYLDLYYPSSTVKNTWVGKSASISMDATGQVVKGKVDSVSNLEEVMNGGILTKKVTVKVANKGGIKSGDMANASVEGVENIGTGTFRAETDTSIVAESAGMIKTLNILEGQKIQKEDLLLTLLSKDLTTQIKMAKLNVIEAEQSLESQKKQMESYTIKAPISGQVITKNKKLGDTIDPATDTQAGPMAIIYDMSYLSFQMNIDELQIHNVKVGQKVSIKSGAFPEETFEGIIDKISLKGNTNNGVTSYPITVKVAKFGSLLPGMNVTGEIIIEEAKNVITIPSSALQRGNTVYIKTSDTEENKDPSIPKGFKSVKVKIGINDGTNVEVISGLKEGDVIYVPYDESMIGNEYGVNVGY